VAAAGVTAVATRRGRERRLGGAGALLPCVLACLPGGQQRGEEGGMSTGVSGSTFVLR
jgi:hypothetical protein